MLVKYFLKMQSVFISLQLQENQDEIENMMNSIFKGIFVHRYRYNQQLSLFETCQKIMFQLLCFLSTTCDNSSDHTL